MPRTSPIGSNKMNLPVAYEYMISNSFWSASDCPKNYVKTISFQLYPCQIPWLQTWYLPALTKPLYSEGWTPFNSIFHAERSLATSQKADNKSLSLKKTLQTKKRWQQKKQHVFGTTSLTKLHCQKKSDNFVVQNVAKKSPHLSRCKLPFPTLKSSVKVRV